MAPQVLVLDATILQSRHAFDASLAELDQALKDRPQDAQAWLTRATVLRVLGRYGEAMISCEHLAAAADSAVTALCTQSLRGLTGHLQEAYDAIASLAPQELAPEVRAWRYSELAEMAERNGNDAAAEHWFREGLQTAPEDFYMRTACADLLLRHGRAAETVQLLAGHESMEPMLLRIAIAHRQLQDGAGSHAEALLSGAFEVEQQRGDVVHRREQARFLLDVKQQPAAALAAAEENWKVQREPDDVLILLRAAQAAHQAQAAAIALQFLRQTGLEDAQARSVSRNDMRTCRLLVAGILLGIALAGAAHAHIASNGFLVANVAGQDVSGSIELAVRDAELAVGVDADRDGKVTWGELRAADPQITAYLAQHVSFMAQSQVCSLAFQALEVNDRVDGSYAWLPFKARCPSAVRQLAIRYTVMEGIDPSHRGLLTLSAGTAVQTGVLGGTGGCRRLCRIRAIAPARLRRVFPRRRLAHIERHRSFALPVIVVTAGRAAAQRRPMGAGARGAPGADEYRQGGHRIHPGPLHHAHPGRLGHRAAAEPAHRVGHCRLHHCGGAQ